MSVKKRPDGKWRARYRDASGKEHARHFDTKREGEAWVATAKADMLRGQYVDPRAGRVTLGAFAEQWLAAQTFNESTRETVESRLKCHVLPTFGAMELRTIRPSTVQAWLRGRQGELAATTVQSMLANVSAILSAAVEDGLIPSNPCAAKSVKAPAAPRRRIVPWSDEQVGAVVDAHPLRYQAVPLVAAGAGMRQGETFGLSADSIDFLRRKVYVRQQIKLLYGKPVFAAPKGNKVREVPLADTLAVALSEQLRRFPPAAVTLPWETLDGEPRTSRLVFVTRLGSPLIRNYFNREVWKPALDKAGVPSTRDNGMHALRHYYASVLLDAGESIRALADYLGHTDPGFTLRTYTHLVPSSEDRARQAVDAALRSRFADQMRTQAAE